MNVATHVQELIHLLGSDVLLLPWVLGSKGGKSKWGHLTADRMKDPAHLRKLGLGNIGVAQGKVSGGLCSLDIDSDEEMEIFLKLNPSICNTLRSRGSRGCNLWWRLLGDYPSLKKLKRFDAPWGEWRSTGAQTIIYGQHPNGRRYEIINRVQPVKIEMIQIKWPEGIYPLLQGGSLVNDTERAEQTEQAELSERIEPAELTERTKVDRSGSVVSFVVSAITNHEEAVRAALPTGTHQNHDRLFRLARAVKALGLHRHQAITLTEMKQIFDKWRTQAKPFLNPSQSQDEYWFEFLEALSRAEHPLGIDVIALAWSNVQGKEPPAVANQFETPQVRMLVSLCRELQSMARDNPFFLSARSVQRLFKLPTSMSGWRWINGLRLSGILKIEKVGSVTTMRATRFRYLPPL